MLATNRSFVCVICGLALSVTGCFRPIGPQSVARDRHLYASSLSDSWKEQTLLNIVKMRYLDPPIFVDVGNIVASYSLVQGISATGNIVPNNQTPDATVGGFGTYSNQRRRALPWQRGQWRFLHELYEMAVCPQSEH
jgi:hypothetical protein